MDDPTVSTSSRLDAADAGWAPEPACPLPGYERRLRKRWQPRDFSWLRPWPLLESANQVIDELLSDIVTPRRQRWVAARRAAGVTDMTFRTVPEDAERFTFLLMGDPGEADESQYAVVEPLLARADGTRFMVIVSDVIYPGGDVNDYVDGFYIPYADYPAAIYALPGNHDWIDGLNGFMFHFCATESLPPSGYSHAGVGLFGRVAAALWRRSKRPARGVLAAYRALRPAPSPLQPGPYWAMDVGPIRVVAIDTGVDGKIDREQAEWLLDVSEGDRPKILLTGKPLLVNDRQEPGEILAPTNDHDEDTRLLLGGDELKTVDAVVRHPGHRYIAAIGGDIHNYQRYDVPISDTRRLQYVVSGGGGAYLSATHTIGPVSSTPEEGFRCYPLRGDSLHHFTGLVRRTGSQLTFASALIAAGLAAAAYVLFHATGTTWSPPLFDTGPITGGFDLLELGCLLAVAAGLALVAPIVVLGDVRRGVENGLKLGAVAAAVIWVRTFKDPTPFVAAGAVAICPLHAALRPRRTAFTTVLAVVALATVPWLLRDTWVAHHTGELLAAVASLLAVYFVRRQVEYLRRWHRPTWGRIGGFVVAAGVAALLVLFGLAKVLFGVVGVVGVLLILFLLASRLALVVPLNLLRNVGRLFHAGWARDATADEATKWLSVRRLDCMPPSRGGAIAVDVEQIPRLARAYFRPISPRTSLGRLAQSKFSEIFDTNKPPFFRSFLRVEVDPGDRSLTIVCHAATGRVAHEQDPPIEDWIKLSFDGRLLAQYQPSAAAQ